VVTARAAPANGTVIVYALRHHLSLNEFDIQVSDETSQEISKEKE